MGSHLYPCARPGLPRIERFELKDRAWRTRLLARYRAKPNWRAQSESQDLRGPRDRGSPPGSGSHTFARLQSSQDPIDLQNAGKWTPSPPRFRGARPHLSSEGTRPGRLRVPALWPISGLASSDAEHLNNSDRTGQSEFRGSNKFVLAPLPTFEGRRCPDAASRGQYRDFKESRRK